MSLALTPPAKKMRKQGRATVASRVATYSTSDPSASLPEGPVATRITNLRLPTGDGRAAAAAAAAVAKFSAIRTQRFMATAQLHRSAQGLKTNHRSPLPNKTRKKNYPRWTVFAVGSPHDLSLCDRNRRLREPCHRVGGIPTGDCDAALLALLLGTPRLAGDLEIAEKMLEAERLHRQSRTPAPARAHENTMATTSGQFNNRNTL